MRIVCRTKRTKTKKDSGPGKKEDEINREKEFK